MLIHILTSSRSLLAKLRGLKQKAFLQIFPTINKFYTRIFLRELSQSREPTLLNDFRTFTFYDILTRFPAIASLNKDKNYFLLHASYGDKWCILSFLPEHFNIYPNSFVLACHQDRGLIEIFLGPTVTANRCIFIDQKTLINLSFYFRPLSRLSMPLADGSYSDSDKLIVTSFFINHGLPPGSIRHLHLVYYPYFNELFSLHGVCYGTLLKVLLYLPASSNSCLPAFYSEQDLQAAKTISGCSGLSVASPLLPAVLLNVVNFSHASLSTAQISLLVSMLEALGYRVLLNVTQSSRSEEFVSLVAAQHREAVLVSVPPSLLALVCDNVHAVIGVLGGAMNVAVQFSGSHVLSLQTSAMFTGCSEDELCGEWGKEKIWEWYNKCWPCLHKGRVVENKFIGNPETLGDCELINAIRPFLDQIGSAGLAN